jgi:hypothetical protein
MDTCHVAFLSQHVVTWVHLLTQRDWKFAQVLELSHDDGVGPTQNTKTHRNHQMVSLGFWNPRAPVLNNGLILFTT